VVLAPGVMIFMRMFFCKMLFWAMTLLSALVWSVLFVVWIFGFLFVSDALQIGLIWLAVTSGLSVFSWLTVRHNDAFDA